MAFKELTPTEWFDELDFGLEYRRRFGLEDKWGKMEAIYYNVDDSRLNDGPNIFLSIGDAMLSTITVPTPSIRVKPRTPECIEKAPLLEALDNTLLRELEFAEEMDRGALHAYLFGRAIWKIGYDSEYGFDPSQDLGGSLNLGLTLTQFDRKGKRRIEYDALTTPGMPWIRSVPPHDIIVPWGTITLRSCPWIAMRFVRHIDDVRADLKYSFTKNLNPKISMKDFMDSYRFPMKSVHNRTNTREAEYIELYEIHDRRTGKIYVITPDHEKFLRNDLNALQIEDQLPFVSMAFTPNARAFWVTPDTYYLYAMQNELSDIAVQRTKQRRLAVLKFIVDGDAISDPELAKILSVDVGAVAKIEGGQEISKAILKLENNPNTSLLLEEEHLRSNVREQIGFSRNQLGEYTGGRRTATESLQVDRASSLRMSRRGLRMQRAYEQAISIMNNIIFAYWSMPKYVELLGETQANRWAQVNGQGLAGKYSYEVTFTEKGELDQRKMQALQLWGVLRQDPQVDPQSLREFLVSQFNDPVFERIFNASVRSGVQEVPPGGRDLLAQLQGSASAVPNLPRSNGQASVNGSARG